jgi:uncharacterized BrkB/YihY/UPF0761 family membrane protein
MTAGVLVAIVAYVGVGLATHWVIDQMREGPTAPPRFAILGWPITVATIIAGIFVLWAVRQEIPTGGEP